MSGFMFGSYQLLSGMLFLMLSAILIYHRLFTRWLAFSIAFFISYLVGSYLLFGRVPEFMNDAVLWPLCVFLLFFGTPACAAYCVFRQLTFSQVAAAVTGYLVALLGLVFWLGFGEKTEVQDFLVSMPYLLFFIGSPVVVGMCVYRGMACSAVFGVYLVFCFCLLGAMVATTSYFDRPFGFAYELAPYTKAWIEIGSAAFGLFSIPAVVGYGLMHGWERRAIFGAATLGVIVIAVVALMVELTIGYEFAWIVRNEG